MTPPITNGKIPPVEKQPRPDNPLILLKAESAEKNKPAASDPPGLFFKISYSPDLPAVSRGNGHRVYQKAQIGGNIRGTQIIFFPHESLEIAAATMVRNFSPPGSPALWDGLAPDGFYFPRLNYIHSAPPQIPASK